MSYEEDLLAGTNYESVRRLGQGSFGFVQLARDKRKNNELVAVKCLKRSEMNKYVEAEILNHSILRHPHVVRFKEVFITSELICIVMEFANGGSLFNRVRTASRLSEEEARWFFQQLMIAVDYCHRRGVANRDIKLENALLHQVTNLPKPLVKICDFGYSKSDCKSAAKSKVGTLTYMAPEVLINGEGHYDGKIADIWSCGVILYVMMVGRYPFQSPQGNNQARDILAMLEDMVHSRYEIPGHVRMSPECLDLLKKLLLPDPLKRINMQGIMSHPWFLQDLPAEAVSMNDKYIDMKPPPYQQTQEQVRALLNNARDATPPNLLQLGAEAPPADGGIDGIIDSAISDEMRDYTPSQNLKQYVEQHRSN